MKVKWLEEGLTAVPGMRVGQISDDTVTTGVTAVLFDRGAIGAADIRGGAASTRQFGSLDAMHVHGSINGVVFAGGSAFGLDAGCGAARYMKERNIGLTVVPGLKIPVVPTAIILDAGLILGKGIHPDANMGYMACEAASYSPVKEGSVGAGTGAGVGKCMGIATAMKGGVGSIAAELPGGARIGALAVVNAFGDIIDPNGGTIVAGLRESPDSMKFRSSAAAIVERGRLRRYGEPLSSELFEGENNKISKASADSPGESTTLVITATDIPLTRVELTHMARLAGHGLVRTISPCHTLLDGDLVVAVGTSGIEIHPDQRMSEREAFRRVDATAAGLVAAEAVARSVLRAVRKAEGLMGVPGLAD